MSSIDPLRPRAFASYIDEVADESTYTILNESLKLNQDKDLAYFAVLASGLIDAKFPPFGLRQRMLEMFMSELGISLAAKIFFDQSREKEVLEKNIRRLSVLAKEEAQEVRRRQSLLEGCYFSYPERKDDQHWHLAELQERIFEVDRLFGKK
ncbi:hypothetical protein N7509_000292 [Penicillium cosmopolitanum]|uniref:Uncharacterized protein n=1 Tax=Penicillium cosmopolitanum TaxID=1131564 RepID=A0A9W9VF12_9EURO|nr:uncharacterized protein N7509_012736 [Penicillium cosmopolitanum]XP_056493521.1 uncharacterized protein N7509_000292 [Penicillium cosmopolitanum]KAJ5379617.1 hypothetical protein N7509_012736 [Penicillium cosmopolitanum]KAJ5413665.1 hypothetical protein N7509_000292 [Penicillium cosmopolitanum]